MLSVDVRKRVVDNAGQLAAAAFAESDVDEDVEDADFSDEPDVSEVLDEESDLVEPLAELFADSRLSVR